MNHPVYIQSASDMVVEGEIWKFCLQKMSIKEEEYHFFYI